MKAILISIQPKLCEKILSGEKTVDVRKTKPKIETPFKCYIYCTKGNIDICPKKIWWKSDISGFKHILNGKIIGEFICDKIKTIQSRGTNHNYDYCYESLNIFGNDDIELEITTIKNSIVSKQELNEYGENTNFLYAWNISNLKIYDKPKKMNKFYNACNWVCGECEYYINNICTSGLTHYKPLKNPPQSWCYVEELEE